MKSYFGESQLKLQGKAWQIRILLKRWQRNYDRDVLLQEVLAAKVKDLRL